MAENEEEIVVEQPVVETSQDEGKNPFDDNNWTENVEQSNNDHVKENVSSETEEEIVDADEFFTKEFGVKKDDLKKEWEELKLLKGKQPEPFKFANEQSEKYFTSIKEGKEDEIYNYLSEKKRFEKLEKADLSKPSEAEEVYKLSIKYKNPDLEPDDIDFLFNERFSVPPKPVQTEDMIDDEYEKAVQVWEGQVKQVQRKLTIEAKLLKPELVKLKSELVLPDIPKQTTVAPIESQESLDFKKAARDKFLNSVETNYQKFDGFETKVKDESVELPISFKVSDDDKKAIKELMQNFDQNTYFQNRWMNEDGTVNTFKMQADLTSLEYRDKINQGIANNAASQRLKHERKTKNNIKLDNGSNNTNLKQPEEQGQKQAEVGYLFANA